MDVALKIVIKIYELILLLALVVLTSPAYYAIDYNVLIKGVQNKGIVMAFGGGLIIGTILYWFHNPLWAWIIVGVTGFFFLLKMLDLLLFNSQKITL